VRWKIEHEDECRFSFIDSILTRKESRCNVEAVTGVFRVLADARRSIDTLRSKGVPEDRITLLTPRDADDEEPIPVDTSEAPGIGKAIGAVVGAAGGLSGGSLLMAVIPGVGPVTALGMLGAAIVGAAGATIGGAVGGAIENSSSQGLPEDEIFVYEDALRKGRSVVIALAEDSDQADILREVLTTEGAETVDAARHEWWIGLRSAERERYRVTGRKFDDDEKFYRLGFEAALHARSRCKEFDQVSAEMATNLEELQKRYPGASIEEAYTRGYQRGREYYQHLCEESKAA
jgi:hypothetical protein